MRREHLPKGRGTPMTQHGPLPASEHSSHPPASIAETGMPNGVNAAMEAMQAAHFHASVNPELVEPRCPQLGDGHHTMLASRDLSDHTVGTGAKVAHSATKATER